METEIRAALHAAWKFVAEDSLGRYLQGILQQLTARIDGAPEGCRVVLIDESVLRIVTLPSGLILMSTGMLRYLEDEAELAFVLARELAHVSNGEVSARVVRASLGALAHDDTGRPDTAWTETMLDLARLGYGRRSELAADAAALRDILALRYDPTSVLNLMRRLKVAVQTANPDVGDVAVAYPPPGYRARKLERILYARVGRVAVQRVNREVFRRVAGRSAAELAFTATEIGEHVPSPPADSTEKAGAWGFRRAVLLILLATLLVALGLVLRF
jgi:predicted Zn-dependent protease